MRVASLSLSLPLPCASQFETVRGLKAILAPPPPSAALCSARHAVMLPLSPVTHAGVTHAGSPLGARPRAHGDTSALAPHAHAAVLRGVDVVGGYGGGGAEALAAALRRASPCRAAGVAAFGAALGVDVARLEGFRWAGGRALCGVSDEGESIPQDGETLDARTRGGASLGGRAQSRDGTGPASEPLAASGFQMDLRAQRRAAALSAPTFRGARMELTAAASATADAVRAALSARGGASASDVEAAAAAAAAACMAREAREAVQGANARWAGSRGGHGGPAAAAQENSAGGEACALAPAVAYAQNSRALLPFLRRVAKEFRSDGARAAFRKYGDLGMDEGDFGEASERLTELADAYGA